MGFLRLATNPKAFPSDALSMLDAWQAYEEILADERVVFAEEPDKIEPAWRGYTHRSTFSTNVWTDAYLAAFAQTSGFELVTFDAAFRLYAGLKHTIFEVKGIVSLELDLRPPGDRGTRHRPNTDRRGATRLLSDPPRRSTAGGLCTCGRREVSMPGSCLYGRFSGRYVVA
jgi:hypothetical protein